MAYPLEATLETAIGNVEAALLENRTLRNSRAAWQSWQEVRAHLRDRVTPDAGYTELTDAGTDFDGV